MTLFTPSSTDLQLDPQRAIRLVKDYDIIFATGSTYEAYLTVVIHGLLKNYSLLGAGCTEREVEDLAETSRNPLLVVVIDSINKDYGIQMITHIKQAKTQTQAILIADNLEKFKLNKDRLDIYDGLVSAGSIGYGGLMKFVEWITTHQGRYIDASLETELQHDDTNGLASLNQRERQILPLLARGMKNREIAKELYIAETTIRDYVSSILSKLHLSNRAAAAAWIIERGLAG